MSISLRVGCELQEIPATGFPTGRDLKGSLKVDNGRWPCLLQDGLQGSFTMLVHGARRT